MLPAGILVPSSTLRRNWAYEDVSTSAAKVDSGEVSTLRKRLLSKVVYSSVFQVKSPIPPAMDAAGIDVA